MEIKVKINLDNGDVEKFRFVAVDDAINRLTQYANESTTEIYKHGGMVEVSLDGLTWHKRVFYQTIHAAPYKYQCYAPSMYGTNYTKFYNWKYIKS